MDDLSLAPTFCPDDRMGYRRCRTQFRDGAGLELDEAYRLAHLPLVAPGHPRVIRSRPGKDYAMGRHPTVQSIVLPVPGGALARSPAYREMLEDVRSSPLSRKVAWEVVERRQHRLHATVCGAAPGPLPPAARQALRRVGPLAVELRGLFSGNINLGRLYLMAYPESRDGRNLLQEAQQALGRQPTDMFLVGLLNLADDLVPSEAAALAGIIGRWWDRPLLRFHADHLWRLASRDDLVLDSEVAEIVSLTPWPGPRAA